MHKKFQGLFVALATFYRQGALDIETLTSYLDWLLDQGVQGVVACGTTGESLALSLAEQGVVLEACVLHAKRRDIPVIAGIASPTLEGALQQAQQAEGLGCDGLLVLTPFYVKPSQEALIAFYKAIHDATNLPLILYNNPGRAAVELAVETVIELAITCPRIVGLKESSPDLTRPLALRQDLPDGFCLLSGDDPTYPAFLAHGGDGIISVTGGVVPKAFVQLRQAWQQGNPQVFNALATQLYPLCQAMFASTSPGPLKWLLAHNGWGDGASRLPLISPNQGQQDILLQAFEDLQHLL